MWWDRLKQVKHLDEKKTRQDLKVAQDRQKSYVDRKRTNREFKVGEHVFLKVKAKRISLKLGSSPKLAARYCGPFEVLENIGPVAYMISLPASMRIHNVFHVSFLKKYVPNPNHVIDWNVIQVEHKFSDGTSAHPGPENQSDQEQIHRLGKGSMDL
jgi:hypothetical protein